SRSSSSSVGETIDHRIWLGESRGTAHIPSHLVQTAAHSAYAANTSTNTNDGESESAFRLYPPHHHFHRHYYHCYTYQ
ncbi:hypothetical protein CSUI_009258, partial [Cystoisospora suis]